MIVVAAYDAILFDFDGVLADTEPLHFRCWKDILAPFGIALDWNVYAASCIGITERLMLARFCEQASPPVTVDALLAQYPVKRDRFRAMIARELPFFPRCGEFLASLRSYKLAVVSSSGRLGN